MSECMTPEAVNEGFLAAPPLIAQQIQDLTIKHPNWLSDVGEMVAWPHGEGTLKQELVFRGLMPPIERGFDLWRKLGNNTGCVPCEGTDCSYNWSILGGHAFDRRLTELMGRDFRTPNYCVHDIQTTMQFKEVFAKIVQNIWAQVAFFKEFNIGQNFLTMVAKKYLVDSDGPKPNTQNPYVYRSPGAARLSTLGMELLEWFYERMRRLPDCVPYDVVDGSPIYALECSHQLLARMYRDDPGLRQDARFSGMANDLLMKYNFMSTIRGMFIPAPILYPRRFRAVTDLATTYFEEVLPFINGIPGEVGTYTGLNPDYEDAQYEEVLLHGKSPFKLYYLTTETSLGQGTSFGPEPSFLERWPWINPQTDSDPFSREGYFASSIKMGLSQQYSDGVFGVLVERPSSRLAAVFVPEPECPPDTVECNNSVPDVECPCPVVISIQQNPFNSSRYYITFATPVTGVVGHSADLQLDSGGTLSGDIIQISDDGLILEIEFTGGLPNGVCTAIVGIACSPLLACSSTVARARDCRSNQTGLVTLTLSQAIRAQTAGQTLTAYFGDCTTASLDIVSVDIENLDWVVEYADGYGPTDDPDGEGATVLSADMICDRGGIMRICVPPETVATCPACEPALTACEEAAD